VVEPPVHGPMNVSLLREDDVPIAKRFINCTTKLKISNWMMSRVIAGAESVVSSEFIYQRG